MNAPSFRWPKKDPDAVLDYSLDWTAWLDDDTIEDSSFTVPSGITKQSETFDDTTTTVWLSGGTAGQIYTVINRIRTLGGRIDDRTIQIRVTEK